MDENTLLAPLDRHRRNRMKRQFHRSRVRNFLDGNFPDCGPNGRNLLHVLSSMSLGAVELLTGCDGVLSSRFLGR